MTISAHTYKAIVPSDVTNFVEGICEGIYVGVAGDIVIVPTGAGAAVTFKNVPVGILPVRAARVNSTGTVATNLVALYFKNPN